MDRLLVMLGLLVVIPLAEMGVAWAIFVVACQMRADRWHTTR